MIATFATIAAVCLALPLFVLALPIIDVSLAILRRGLKGLPLFRPDRKHLSFCRRLDNSGGELAATGDVPCATARKVEAEVFSARCSSKNRCVLFGFTCLAPGGRYDGSFGFTNAAICHDGARRIVIGGG